MKLRGKRGQATIFIIIAIVVIGVALFVIFLRPRITDLFMSEQQATQTLASQVDPIRDAVADCVTESSKDFFIILGANGGYYDPGSLPTIFVGARNYVVVMYKDNNMVRVNKLPSLTEIENQYINYLQDTGYDKIDSCLNNFNSFRNMDIEPGVRSINTDIKDDSIFFKVDWPITIKKHTITKTVSQTITQKDAELLIPLGKAWNVAADIVECEVQIGCNFEGVKIDEYIFDNPELLQYISFRLQKDPPGENYAWILETQPYREQEEKYNFYFGIMRD